MKFIILTLLFVAFAACGGSYSGHHGGHGGGHGHGHSGGHGGGHGGASKYSSSKNRNQYSKKYNGGKFSENKRMKKMVKQAEKQRCVDNWMKHDAQDFFKNKQAFKDYLKSKHIDNRSIKKLCKKNFKNSKSSKKMSLNKERLNFGKLHQNRKYYKKYYDHKIAYTIKKGSHHSVLNKRLGKFCKFGKVKNTQKKFGFFFKFSKCAKNYKDYTKNLQKYKKTNRACKLRKAKKCFSKFLKSALFAKKEFTQFKKKCGEKYAVYQKSLRDYEKYKKTSSMRIAQNNFNDFCNCSRGAIGQQKWNKCKKDVKFGCKGLMSNGCCHY